MPLRRLSRFFVGILSGIVLLGVHDAGAQDQTVVDEIVAVVDNTIILRSEVDGLVANALRQQTVMADTEELWMEALDQIISQHVMAAVAKRDTNLAVSEDEVTQAMERRINQMIAQVGGQARLEELYGRSLVRIRSELREDFRNQLLADKLQQEKLRGIRITPTEVREWFNQFPVDSLPVLPETVRLAHVVRYPEVTEAAKRDARDVISAIRDSIVIRGTPMETMARRFSDDTGSASVGGRIEDIRLAELVPEFAAVASRSPVGEISQVFESTFGFHILRVNERRGEFVDLNHVLIRIDDSQIDPAPTIDVLQSIRDSIVVHGAPFALMARRHSQEEQSAQLGGRVIDPRSGERDLVLGSLSPLWRQTLDTMVVGQISRPARVDLEDNRRAFHIVHLQRRVPEHRLSLETDYERIEQLALQDKRARLLDEWIRELRDEVYIDLRGKAERIAALARR